jgi:hypothetical protein
VAGSGLDALEPQRNPFLETLVDGPAG